MDLPQQSLWMEMKSSGQPDSASQGLIQGLGPMKAEGSQMRIVSGHRACGQLVTTRVRVCVSKVCVSQAVYLNVCIFKYVAGVGVLGL